MIVGAGFSGAVMAERLATQLNKKVIVVEKRIHIGGNAYDEQNEHGILIHRYGPHIFHTNNKDVFDYLSQFTEWTPYEHKVLANHQGNLYPIPINRITLNKLYGKNFKSDVEVENYYESVRQKRNPILNSEDIIVNKVGYDLFDKFFRNYTKKQWGKEPKDLSPSVCGRIPIRTNDDCRYFTDKYQFMPKDGYTSMFEKMLNNNNIEIVLGTDYKTIQKDIDYKRMIYTGPIDYFFDYVYGRLAYRSIQFTFEHHKEEFHQSNAVINYVDRTKEFSRSTEYKYITGQRSSSTMIGNEKFISSGEPYYPVHNDNNGKSFEKYCKASATLKNVIFCGRLAEYKYYNMDQVVANGLEIFSRIPYGK